MDFYLASWRLVTDVCFLLLSSSRNLFILEDVGWAGNRTGLRCCLCEPPELFQLSWGLPLVQDLLPSSSPAEGAFIDTTDHEIGSLIPLPGCWHLAELYARLKALLACFQLTFGTEGWLQACCTLFYLFLPASLSSQQVFFCPKAISVCSLGDPCRGSAHPIPTPQLATGTGLVKTTARAK